MSTLTIVLLVILVVLIIACVVLYFLGKRAEKKQAEQQASEKRDPGDGDDTRFVPQRLGFRDERKKEHAKRTGDSSWKQKQRQYHSA